MLKGNPNRSFRHPRYVVTWQVHWYLRAQSSAPVMPSVVPPSTPKRVTPSEWPASHTHPSQDRRHSFLNHAKNVRPFRLVAIVVAMLLLAANARSQSCLCDSGTCFSDCSGITANPSVSPMCPLRITIVLDESGSIAGTGSAADIADDVRSAALNFLTSLVSSNISVSVVDFNSQARMPLGNTYFAVTTARVSPGGNLYEYLFGDTDSGGMPTDNKYDPEDYSFPDSYTNWEAAFLTVGNLTLPPDIVVFFTDGNPTAWCTDANCSSFGRSTTGCTPHVAGKSAANVLKSNGTRIFGLGFPNNVLIECNMQHVTGLNQYDPGNSAYDDILSEADYVSVTNSSQLNSALMAIADALTVPCTISSSTNPVCSGSQTTLTVNALQSGPWTYAWNVKGNGTIIGTSQSIIVSPTSTTTYEVTITDTRTGCLITCEYEVMVVPAPTCTASASDASCPGSTDGSVTAVGTGGSPGYTYSIDGGNNFQASGTFANLGIGTYTVLVQDANGCVSSCMATINAVDTQNPTITCPADITVSNDAGQCGAIVNFTTTFDDNCPGATLSCVPASGSFFAVGTSQVTCTVTDAAGNTATCTFDVTVNDTQIPTITCPADITVSNDAGQCGAIVNFTTTFDDNCPGATLACVPASGSFFAVGTTQVTCTVTDAAGNTATCTFDVTVNDTQIPTITCPADITVSNNAGQCGAMVNFTTTFDDNCPGAALACVPASGSFFAVGTTQVVCTVTDAAGNTATCTFDVTVNDTQNPTITCPADITVSNDAGQCGAIVNFTTTFDDNCPGATLACVPASGSFFAVGTTQVTCTVTDAAGNTATCTFDVTVNDTQIPTISCPADITVSNDAGQCGAIVNFTTTFDDNCPGATLACVPASGSFFAVGTTQVTCTVTDATGNTATCTFDVTVNDTQNPTITCPADITVSNDPGQCGAIVNFTTTFDDNCPGATLACVPASGSFFAVGTTQVTCTVTDAAGNTATCTFDVTVNDTQNPTITCPADITVSNDAGQCGAMVNFTTTFDDNCPGATLACVPASGSLFAVGTTQVTCTVTDAAGNTATCTFDVTVNDTQIPTITCPADITVSNDAGQCGAIVNFTTTFDDNCPGATLACVPASGSFFAVGTTQVTCTVTDAAGNTATCTFDVTVNDTQIPTISCPADITVSNDAGQCGAIVNFTTTFDDNCPGATLACVPASGSFFAVGTTQVTCTVTDAAGNTATCTFDVTVNDTQIPTISCPADITVSNDAGQCGAIVNFTTTFDDNCPGATLACVPASGSFFAVGTTQVTCTVTDAAGNTATCTFDVTVNDTQNPTITCPADITVSNDPGQCGAIVNFTTTFDDNCPGTTLACVPASGSLFAVGTTQVTCTVTDAAGNTTTCTFDVTVNDTQIPTITCPADITVSNDAGQCGAIANFTTTFDDNCPGATLSCVPASGSFFAVGTTQVTCTVTDAAGNTATCTFDVTVNDTQIPTITCPADITVSNDAGQCGAIVNFTTTFDDNCPGATLACVPASGSFFAAGTTQVTCTVTDAAGNTATCTFDVTVNDTQNPTITCPADITVSNDAGQCGAMVNFTTTFDDNCPGATLACVPASGSLFAVGTTQVTCTVTDAAGNTATCTFDVTVNDTQIPTITCPADITVSNDAGQCGAIVNFTTTFDDNCPGATLACVPASGSFFAVGTTQVTCTVTDAAGNTATCTFDVTVNDTQIPTISCPADITVSNDPGQCGAIVNFTTTFDDNCPAATLACVPASGSFFAAGTTQVTCTVTDAAGNTATCTFDVTVNDTQIPTISCPADITVSNDVGLCGAIVNFTTTFDDNCPGATLACVPASGSLFAVGTTQVTCTVTDAAGNTATCTFDVTVNDTQIPTIICPADITVSNDPGQCGAIVNFTTTFDDNCPGATLSCVPASGSFFAVGTTQVTCSVTDAAGNTATCTFDVTVNDTQIPTITCPADITVSNDAGQCGAIVNFTTTFDDNCPGATLSCVPASGAFFAVGKTQVTCTVTDAAGNTATCTFDVTVNDTQIPTITCPADITVSNDAGQCGAIVNFTTTFDDNCPGATLACVPASGSLFAVGTNQVTCTVTDAAGNTTTCTFDVTVNDTQIPTITCPADITVSNDAGQCGAIVNFTTTFDDNCPGATLACVPASGSFFAVGTTQVTCTVTDAAGNTATCTFDVTVNDTQIPTITCPADITVSNDAGQCGAIVNFTTTFDDNCPGATLACVPASGSLFAVGTNQVTCTVTDAAGNTTTCTFDVTVNDTQIPTITCPADITVSNDAGQCGAIVNFTTTFDDNCPGATLACVPASGSLFAVGTTQVTCTVTDAAGNTTTCTFDVTVNDTQIPTITCPADITVSNDAGQCGAIVNFTTTFDDNCPGATLACVPASGSFFAVGTTQVTCTVTDAAGNTATCTFDVTVNDTQIPTITCPADITVSNDPGQCGAIVNFTTTFDDNCPGATLACVPASGSFFAVGTTQVTCTVTDAAGNTATCTFDVTVNDTQIPTITCPADITVSNDTGQCGAMVNFTTTFDDNCPGATLSCVPASGSFFAVGTTQVTCTVTDAAGNTATCTFDVTVNDTQIPTITCPADITVSNDAGQCGAIVNFTTTFDDNCPAATLACVPASGSFFAVGTTQVTCTVTDAAGNTATCTFDVTVIDTQIPTITCPADITVSNDPGQCGAIVNFTTSFDDNCPAATLACVPASGSLFAVGTTQVCCTVTDAAGNTTQCCFDVTVTDTESPTISCPPGDNGIIGCSPDALVQATSLPLQPNGENCITPAQFAAEGGSALGNCEVNICYSDIVSGPCPYLIERVFRLSDDAAHEVTCTTTYMINPPSLSFSCPPDTLLENDQTQLVIDQAFAYWKAQFDYNGGCTASVAFKIDDVVVDLDTLSAPDACGGEVTVEMLVSSDCQTDSCESQFTVIRSVQGLLLTLPATQSTCSNDPDPPTLDDIPPVRSDEQIVSSFLLISGCVDPGQINITHTEQGPTIVNGSEYQFERTYFVTAPNSLSADATETFVILHDPDGPVLSGLPEDLVLPCGSPIPPMPEVTAFDVVYGPVPVTGTSTESPSVCGLEIVRTWTAVDGCNNTVSGTQTILVVDDEPPTLRVPSDTLLACGEAIPAPYHVVSDGCSRVAVDFHESVLGDASCEHSIIRTWEARDGCGNVTTKRQTITIRDDEPPMITVVNPTIVDIPLGGELVMFGCDIPEVAMSDIEISDCCDVEVEVSDRLMTSGVCDIFGYYRKWICSYVATDAAGNISEHFFYVLQYDTSAPVLYNVPGFIEVHCDSLIPAADVTVYGEDDCPPEPILHFEEDTLRDPTDSSKFALIRTWSMEDRCGNLTEASQVVSVCGFDTTLITSGLGNTVWIDSDANGLQDPGEPGLNDVTVYLNCMEEGLGFVRVDSTATRRSGGQDGQFFFDYLMPDDYQLQFVVPDNWRLTLANQGSDDHLDSDADELTGMTEVITLTSFDKLTNFDAGMVLSTALPVELSDFHVRPEECNSRIQWSTLSEQGIDRFEIQRSADGVVFESIEVIEAPGSSIETRDYTFLDTQPLAKNTYRLKVMEVDGTVFFSSLQSLDHPCREGKNDFAVFPNPSQGVFHLSFSLDASLPVGLRVYDKLGQVVHVQKWYLNSGRQVEPLDLQRLPNGIYSIQITIDGALQYRTVVKTK